MNKRSNFGGDPDHFTGNTPFTRNNRLSNRVIQLVWQPAVYTIQPVVKAVAGWMFVYTIQPFVKPVWQPVWQPV